MSKWKSSSTLRLRVAARFRARSSVERMAAPSAGVMPWNGNRNPVNVVAAVVVRKMIVQWPYGRTFKRP